MTEDDSLKAPLTLDLSLNGERKLVLLLPRGRRLGDEGDGPMNFEMSDVKILLCPGNPGRCGKWFDPSQRKRCGGERISPNAL